MWRSHLNRWGKTCRASQVAQWWRTVCQCRRHKGCKFDPWIGKIPWSRKWQPTPIFLRGKFHGERILAGYSPWGLKESAMAEHTYTKENVRGTLVKSFQLSCLSGSWLSSVQFSCSVVSNSLRPHKPQHARPPCPSHTAGVYPNPCPLSLCMEFFRQDYWSGLPCPPPGDVPDPGIKPVSLTSPALAGKFFTT